MTKFLVKASQYTAAASMDKAIDSLIAAVVELCTNVDDSYERIANNGKTNFDIKKWTGDAVIEYTKGNVKKPTYFSIRDRAEGFSYEKLTKILKDHGESIESGSASRGIFNRGLLDCHSIGNLIIYTSDDGESVSIAKMKHKSMEGDIVKSKMSKEIKKLTGIKKHGTFIELEIPVGSDSIYAPTEKKLIENTSNIYPLRNMLCPDKGDYKNTLNLKINNQKINYIEPDKIDICDIKFQIPIRDNKTTEAHFKLYKSHDELPTENRDDMAHYGILIGYKKAIIGKSFLFSKYSRDPSAKHYFGELKCDYIHDLAKEFRIERIKGKLKSDNQECIIDNERKGINEKHPFIKLLFEKPSEIIDQEILKDKNQNKSDASTKNIKDMGKKLINKIEEMAKELETGVEDNSEKSWYSLGAFKTEVGQKKKIRVYASKEVIIGQKNLIAKIADENKSHIKLSKTQSTLKRSLIRDDRYIAEFEVEGIKVIDNAKIQFIYENNVTCSSSIKVFQVTDRKFSNDIEFEFDKYTVKPKGKRVLRVYAQYPVSTKDHISHGKIFISNQKAIKGPTSCKFKHISGTNYSLAEIKIEGLKLDDTSEVIIKLDDKMTSTYVEVKNNDDKKPKYDFDITYENLGDNVRAAFDIHNPNKLLITTKHKMVRKYLGAQEKINGEYPGESTTEWKMYFADIMSEMFSQKLLELTASNTQEYVILKRELNIPDTINQVVTFYNSIKKKVDLAFYTMV